MRTVAMLAAVALALAAAEQVAIAQQPGEALRLHPDNPHYLLFRGKPAILITSGEHYGAVMNLDFDYIRYLDELAARGLNLTRTFSGTYREIPSSFGITDNTLAPRRYLAPWARSGEAGAADGGNKYDLTSFNDDYFKRLREFVSAAGKRGIVVEYVLFCPFYNEDLWKINAMNAANNISGVGQCPRSEVYTLKHADMLAVHEAFVKKAVGELNEFDNVYFEICNEPYFGGVTLEWQARIARTIAQTENALNTKHLIAQNIANKGAKIDRPDPLVSIFNFHYAHPPDTVAENYGLKKAIADDETGFRGKADALYRTEAWDFIIAGGGIYSNLDYSFTTAHPSGDLNDYRSPGGGSAALRAQLRVLKDFMEAFDFVRMAPRNELMKGGSITAPLGGAPARVNATVRVLAEPGRAYAIYVHGGTNAQLRIELPAGSYKAGWINTKNGKVEKSEELKHEGGERALESPAYEEDIALRILKG